MNEYKWKTPPVWAFLFKVQSINGKRSHISAAGDKTDLSAFFPLSSRVCLKLNIMVQNHRTVFSTMYILAKVNSDEMSIFNHFTLLFPPE